MIFSKKSFNNFHWLRIAYSLLSTQYALMLEYRMEILLWAISGMLPLIMLSIWSNSDARLIAGISKEQLSSYFISAFVVRQFTAVWVMVTFEEDYIEGKLSPFLLQPIAPFWRYITSHVAEQITRIPIVILMLALLFTISPESFFLPSLYHLFLGIIAIYTSFLVRFLLHWLFAMLCFWNERAAAFERVLLIPYIFFSGLVAPLEAFPDRIHELVMLTPFPYFLAFPARLLSGAEVNISQEFIVLFLWGILFWLVGLIAWRKGIRHYSAMGA